MSAETDWVLDQLVSVVDWAASTYTLANGDAVTIKRVDRNDSQVYDGSQTVDMSSPIHSRKEQLQRAIYIGAKETGRSRQYIGSDPDYRGGPTIRVRIDGLTALGGEYGHIDPSGDNGVPFTGANSLVRKIQDKLTTTIAFPSVSGSRGTTVDFEMVNDQNLSGNWADFYRYDFDLIFTEFQER